MPSVLSYLVSSIFIRFLLGGFASISDITLALLCMLGGLENHFIFSIFILGTFLAEHQHLYATHQAQYTQCVCSYFTCLVLL